MPVIGEHCLGLSWAQAKSPTLQLRSGQAFSQRTREMGGWPSRTLARHGMPHPWQFHGWAAANSLGMFICHSEIVAFSLHRYQCRPTCTATAALDTRTLLPQVVIKARPLLGTCRSEQLPTLRLWEARPVLVNEARKSRVSRPQNLLIPIGIAAHP